MVVPPLPRIGENATPSGQVVRCSAVVGTGVAGVAGVRHPKLPTVL